MMSRGVELPWVIFGRRIRPFSFVLMLATLIIGIEFNVTQTGPGSGIAAYLSGGFSFLTVFLLALGWWLKNDDVHDWGLLIAAGVWGARSTLFILDTDFKDVGTYLSLCWMVGALGAYALERYDHKWRYHLVARDE